VDGLMKLLHFALFLISGLLCGAVTVATAQDPLRTVSVQASLYDGHHPRGDCILSPQPMMPTISLSKKQRAAIRFGFEGWSRFTIRTSIPDMQHSSSMTQQAAFSLDSRRARSLV